MQQWVFAVSFSKANFVFVKNWKLSDKPLRACENLQLLIQRDTINHLVLNTEAFPVFIGNVL
jgi:hypothetical protein